MLSVECLRLKGGLKPLDSSRLLIENIHQKFKQNEIFHSFWDVQGTGSKPKRFLGDFQLGASKLIGILMKKFETKKMGSLFNLRYKLETFYTEPTC